MNPFIDFLFPLTTQVGTVEGRSPPPEHPVAGVYGEGIPFGDPYWYNKNFKSPYYTPGHEEFRAKVRAFVEKELRPYVQQWDEVSLSLSLV